MIREGERDGRELGKERGTGERLEGKRKEGKRKRWKEKGQRKERKLMRV